MDTYCCVLFIDDFKYDVINVKHIERSQVSKSKSAQMEKGGGGSSKPLDIWRNLCALVRFNLLMLFYDNRRHLPALNRALIGL